MLQNSSNTRVKNNGDVDKGHNDHPFTIFLKTVNLKRILEATNSSPSNADTLYDYFDYIVSTVWKEKVDETIRHMMTNKLIVDSEKNCLQ